MPSFWKILLMCVLTVTSLMRSSRPTSALRSPRATWRTISRSRRVRDDAVGPRRPAATAACRAGGIQTSPAATARTAVISVSMANRLKTTPRAPARIAATASSVRSLAVTTTMATGSASASMSARALRSIWRSSSSTSQRCRSRVARRSPARSTSATTVTSGCRESMDLSPCRNSAWSSATMTRMGIAISRSRQLDQEVATGLPPLSEHQLASELADPGRDRPRGLGPLGKPDTVVVDREHQLAGHRPGVDGGRAGAGMPADVADALQHDLKDLLDERRRAGEVSMDRETRGVVAVERIGGGLQRDQRPDVRAKLVVLALHAGLELAEVGHRFGRATAPEQLLAGLEPQVHTSEGLGVPVVERPRDALALHVGL